MSNYIEITSNDDDFLGFYISGDGEYTINNAHIELNGDGTDDFIGLGAGITVTDNAKLTVNNTTIKNFGIGRGTAFADGHSEVTFLHFSRTGQ